jgi:lipoteichoic acid synthase
LRLLFLAPFAPRSDGTHGESRAMVDAALIRVCCTGAVLAILLLALRGKILFTRADLRSPTKVLRGLAVGAYADLAYVVGLTCAFAVLCLLARGRPRLQRLTLLTFAVAASLSLLLGFANVRAIAELGRPVNYQWLYYSHFMRSLDTYTALSTLLSWSWVAGVASACLVLLLASHLVAHAAVWAARKWSARRVGAVTLGGLSAYFVVVGVFRETPPEWKPATLENPVVALVGSILDADTDPVLAKMPTRFGPDDFLPAGAPGRLHPQSALTARARQAGVRNVVIVVLESVAAQYLWGFGAADSGRTPELERAQHTATRFPTFYAHQPSTTHSLLALLLSVYPPHSFRVVTREHPDVALPSLSGELKRRGYRTAIINAEDNRFQRADVFLSHRQFDLVADSRTGSCEASPRDLDDCMVRDLTRWIDRDSLRPFFAVLWTAQTHFPYLAPNATAADGQGSATGVPDRRLADSLSVRFTRYLHALRETDRAMGHLFRSLEERALLDSTLIVVFGDHGEAFGQHGNAFHRFLYEEEVRVPLLLINSRLFHGTVDSAPGGTIDLAPTVMDLLGYQIPAEWQGRSLFDSRRHDRVYLFGPYSGLFGYREGTRKFIHDPIANEDELYDLSSDPGETLNIASRHPGAVQEGRERLAAWVQHLDSFYRRYGVSK